MEIGVYIHIPFCIRKCYYCDFNSYPLEGELAKEYLEALKLEIKRNTLPAIIVKSIYIGGGTPTVLKGEEIAQILNLCYKTFRIREDAEITIEANPGTVDKAKLARLKEVGVNRLSLGAQAWQDHFLKRIGRIHTVADFLDSYNLAREVGFNNINFDLIYGLPGQSSKDWEETLTEAIALRPEHVSLYNLTIEEGTEFYRLQEAGKLVLPGEDEELAMYQTAITRLGKAGYEHYEISNFALPGRRSRHNQSYWHNEEYLGLGAGAFSYLNKRRYYNVRDSGEYNRLVKSGHSPIAGGERLEGREEMGETAILGLRLIEGLDLSEFRARFGRDLRDVFSGSLNKLKAWGLIRINSGRIKLTERGLFLSNEVFQEFL